MHSPQSASQRCRSEDTRCCASAPTGPLSAPAAKPRSASSTVSPSPSFTAPPGSRNTPMSASSKPAVLDLHQKVAVEEDATVPVETAFDTVEETDGRRFEIHVTG